LEYLLNSILVHHEHMFYPFIGPRW